MHKVGRNQGTGGGVGRALVRGSAACVPGPTRHDGVMTKLTTAEVLKKARAHGLTTDSITLAGRFDEGGVLHSDKKCRLKSGTIGGYVSGASIDGPVCTRCGARARAIEGGATSRFTYATLSEFLLAGIEHLEAPEVPDARVLALVRHGATSRWSGPGYYSLDYNYASGPEMKAWEEAVQAVLRARKADLIARAGGALFGEVKLEAARELLGFHEAGLNRFRRIESKLEELAQEVADDKREYLVTTAPSWQSSWWALEVVVATHCLPLALSDRQVLKVPAVVLERLEKDSAVAEAVALGRTSSAELESFSALYNPRGGGDVSTLKGALKVARAL